MNIPTTRPLSLTPEELRLKDKLLGLFDSNLTRLVGVKRANPDSNIPAQIDSARSKYSEHIEALVRDRTKSDGQKILTASKSAQALLEQVIKLSDSERRAAYSTAESLTNKVEQNLRISGTTDFLIRQNQLSVIKDMPFSELMTLLHNDPESCRAMELPAAKHIFRLKTDSRRAAAVREGQTRTILGDEFEVLQSAERQVEALDTLGADLADAHGRAVEQQRKIEETVVSSPISTGA